MQRSAHSYELFHEGSVDADDISPSVKIRRTRRLAGGAVAGFDLVYTEQLWAPVNNTLAGCAHFEAWQAASRWILVTDESYNGLVSAMLQGAENLTADATDVLLIDPERLLNTLLNLTVNDPTVLIVAVDRNAIDFCARQLDAWMQTCVNASVGISPIHMIWLPTSRAEQTLPVHVALEALAWCSYTVVCDLANLPAHDEAIKESTLMMIRAAVFIDAQFMYWLEGNLSAMSEGNEELHQRAIMRAATSILTVKRRRSDEPPIPMAFSDTPALRYTQPNNEETPGWEIQARQLYVDTLYAHAADHFSDADLERIERVLEALDMLSAAKDQLLVTPVMQELPDSIDPIIVLTELGTAIYTRELLPEAWEQANK